ncbi:hypothetical protein NDU88_011251 [Pleurodeles waltl]|uniref:Uncharacterized protein n=1 Tax=Pleurodeles waltl TaxID=8319 RepID=A0AAV7S5L1_PLEWA|nr:hypothetical protein NDU88_011251 [Pleurodeles waltl]
MVATPLARALPTQLPQQRVRCGALTEVTYHRSESSVSFLLEAACRSISKDRLLLAAHKSQQPFLFAPRLHAAPRPRAPPLRQPPPLDGWLALTRLERVWVGNNQANMELINSGPVEHLLSEGPLLARLIFCAG